MSTSSSEALSSLAQAVASAESAKTTTSRAWAGIRHGVSQASEQLADTREAVANKVPLPSGITGRWQATKDGAHAAVGHATQQLQEDRKTVQGEASEVTGQAKRLTNQVAAQVPAPVAERVTPLAVAVRQRPVSAVAMVFAVCALLLLRRALHRARG